MAHAYWPLFDLVVRTPRLELRYPDDADCTALAALAARGIHDPETMPFGVPWTDAPSPQLERSALQYHWGRRSSLSPASWALPMVAVVDGAVAGTQELFATDFAVTRAAATGSWLGRDFQGCGLGTEMRSAILHLAFAGLGAAVAYTAAWHDNAASLGVTRALGYEANGELVLPRRGVPTVQLQFRLTCDRWREARRDDIEIDGLEPCRDLLTAAPPDVPTG